MKTLSDNPLDSSLVELYDPEQFFENQIFTASEAARFLKVSQRTLYRRVKAGEIPFKRLGRHLRFSAHTLMEWIKKGG